MPTGHPNVKPMSINRSPVRMPGGEVAKKEKNREGRRSLPCEAFSIAG